MAKKANKRDLSAITPKGADLPYLMKLDENEWHDLNMNLDFEMSENDKGWSCYKVDFEHDGESLEDEEIPFWAMEAFFDAVQADYEKGETDMQLQFKRRVVNGKNKAYFREV